MWTVSFISPMCLHPPSSSLLERLVHSSACGSGRALIVPVSGPFLCMFHRKACWIWMWQFVPLITTEAHICIHTYSISLPLLLIRVHWYGYLKKITLGWYLPLHDELPFKVLERVSRQAHVKFSLFSAHNRNTKCCWDFGRCVCWLLCKLLWPTGCECLFYLFRMNKRAK